MARCTVTEEQWTSPGGIRVSGIFVASARPSEKAMRTDLNWEICEAAVENTRF
jgi:hypothetical protein